MLPPLRIQRVLMGIASDMGSAGILVMAAYSCFSVFAMHRIPRPGMRTRYGRTAGVPRDHGTAAVTTISIFQFGLASFACTVARAGVAPWGTH